MKKLNNTELSGMCDKFSKLSVSCHNSMEKGDFDKGIRALNAINKLYNEIMEYQDIGKKAILNLVESDKPAVVLKACYFSLPFNSRKSLKALKKIKKSHNGIYEHLATQMLYAWKKGWLYNNEHFRNKLLNK